ncbi:hypothetical protein CK227_10375 [Mesorhizobium sp. WSM4308]|uniref:hypothetical protein n=1 Tax=Mesorhizobium sp. WSM4308 TaxID=2029409 RepID=UPI000BAF9BFF|nr:hypothetical protein [Mesorhizobium sp. WSM4308]PBB75188.1 hypothetical protein CK227_10375 [Mesorhizobium sp. WSM4308]
MVDLAKHANMTDVLTVPRAAIARSIVGMAHFASTGPAGASCGQCEFWVAVRKKMICEKYRSLTGDDKKAIPVTTPACRHFVERPE